MSSTYETSRHHFCSWINRLAVVVVAMALSHCASAELTAGMAVVNPNTGHLMLVFGYDDGTLEFRDWQGTVLQVRYGFGEVTALSSWRVSGSPLPRLFVASTDSGGALRVIDPANINTDLAARFGFGRITAFGWYEPDRFYVGSTDAGGTLRRLNPSTLADEAVRYGFGEITAMHEGWEATGSVDFLLVGSTDSGGTLRCLDVQTLANYGPQPRYGFGRIYDLAAYDADRGGSAEVVIASSDSGGTVRFVQSPFLNTDLATRYGFGTVYGVAYGPVGVTQCDNEGMPGNKVSVVVGSFDGGGTVRRMEVDADTLATTLADSVPPRYGFGTIGLMGLPDVYQMGVDLVAVLSADGGTCAAHIMDENLTDLSSFFVP